MTVADPKGSDKPLSPMVDPTLASTPDPNMPQNLVWKSRDAEAAFWQQMQDLDQTRQRLDGGGWRGLLDRLPFRRRLIHSRIALITASAEELVRQHAVEAEAPASPAEESLRRLAGLAVSLRQDRGPAQGAVPTAAETF
ncbi:hypothetical protein [Aureimonas sp. SK2]|uniref:hypothetical protein n=1 Tax=Aureimonas sp. SK2 TaxID=3015992 RepID=UPI0024447F84|nr:hypothetical protein [Aureimonas sp. SK2]